MLVLLDLVLAQQQRHGHLADGVAAGTQQVGALLGTERGCYTIYGTVLCWLTWSCSCSTYSLTRVSAAGAGVSR